MPELIKIVSELYYFINNVFSVFKRERKFHKINTFLCDSQRVAPPVVSVLNYINRGLACSCPSFQLHRNGYLDFSNSFFIACNAIEGRIAWCCLHGMGKLSTLMHACFL